MVGLPLTVSFIDNMGSDSSLLKYIIEVKDIMAVVV